MNGHAPPKAAGGSVNAAHRDASGYLLLHKTSAVKSYGPPLLCTWRYWTGICRLQTSSPAFARKLSQRSGARLVAWSVNKGYLRIFQEEIEPWRARLLVSRYLKAANGAFSGNQAAQNRSEIVSKVKRADALSAAIGGRYDRR